MSEIKTGGPAFPHEVEFSNPTYGETWRHKHGGMTLRDYIAAKAMQGLTNNISGDIYSSAHISGLATVAYAIADAMIAEREKGGA